MSNANHNTKENKLKRQATQTTTQRKTKTKKMSNANHNTKENKN